MGTLKDTRGVKVPVPLAETSNWRAAIQHQHFQTSRTSMLAAVRAGRRTDTDAPRFLLGFGEFGESSATQDRETYREQLIFLFTGEGF